MRHRIKSGKIGSFNPERVEVPEELQEEQASLDGVLVDIAHQDDKVVGVVARFTLESVL